jgi:hypothetical protein
MRPEERFMAKVEIDPETGCWIWTAYRMPRKKGKLDYGVFQVNGKATLAHRWAYEHWIGPIPEGLGLTTSATRRSASTQSTSDL